MKTCSDCVYSYFGMFGITCTFDTGDSSFKNHCFTDGVCVNFKEAKNGLA